MKRNHFDLIALLMTLLFSANACAFELAPAIFIDTYCDGAGNTSLAPEHPGVSDVVAFRVRLGVGQVVAQAGQPAFLVLNKTVVGPGNNLEIDTVITTDASPFAAYTTADATFTIIDNTFTYGGLLGPLAAGQYSVTVSIAKYDASTRMLSNECGGPWNVGTLTISNQPGPTSTGDVVEFHNVVLNRYFVTQGAGEIAVLDSGQIAGWSRTGLHFLAYLPGGSDGRGLRVVRGYKPSTVGHLFTVLRAEFDYVNFGTISGEWLLESFDAFELPVPNVVTGQCPVGTVPLYRFWDGRSDADHRYTTDAGARQQMIDLGYITEGFGPDSVFLCALAPPAGNP